MAKTIKEERLRWVLPIVKKEVKLVEVAKVFPHGTRTLERWAAAYKKYFLLKEKNNCKKDNNKRYGKN